MTDYGGPKARGIHIVQALDMGDGWINCLDNLKNGYRIDRNGRVERTVRKPDDTYVWHEIDGDYADMVRDATEDMRRRGLDSLPPK